MTFRRSSLWPAVATLALVTAFGGGTAVKAEAPPAALIAQSSPAGNYLAARLALSERDTGAAAAYYRALARVFPRNGEILERAFLTALADGEVDEAVDYAQQIVKIDANHSLARLVLGVKAMKTKQYVTARSNLRRAGDGAIAELSTTLMSAWSQWGSGNARAGVSAIDALQGPEWYQGFKDLHAGLILDAAGVRKDAGKRLEQALKLDPRSLRVVDAYARWASHSGDKDLAVSTYEAYDKVVPNDPLVAQALDQLRAGKTLPPLITSPQAGSAEVLYGLGAALGRQGGEDFALIYLQLGRWLDPSHPLIEVTLADLYQSMDKHAEAITLFRAVPDDSPLKLNAEIQLGINLNAAGRKDEAEKTLEQVTVKNPKDLRALMALGDVLRANEKYEKAAEVYTKAINEIQAPTPQNWTLYYFRGISYERTKEWAKSEADLKKALELRPDQPHVLNYLGYSWIDQGVHLDDGMEMIRKAVTLRPDDGYFIDSLGWAYYRIGKYDDAVRELERAAELKPNEAVISDHLGDAYWKVGRHLEARFKWNQARDLDPDADELAKIDRKIAVGLDEAEKAQTVQSTSTESAPPSPVAEKPAGGGG